MAARQGAAGDSPFSRSGDTISLAWPFQKTKQQVKQQRGRADPEGPVLWRSRYRWEAKEGIIPHDARLTRCCLGVIDKSWVYTYLNAQPGWFSPIRITVWLGFAGWNHMKNKSEGLGCSCITAARLCFAFFWDATDHSLIPLCCLCKSHVAGLISFLLLGSGWTWSSLVVCIDSRRDDYRVCAVTLCGS